MRPEMKRPAAGDGGAEHVSVSGINGTSSVSHAADDAAGTRRHDHDPLVEGRIPLCTCGAQCSTHGLIGIDDRLAAWMAGYERGMVDGRFSQVDSELDALALREAADLLQWVKTRTLALAATGPNWAGLVAGPKPGAVVSHD